MRKQSNEVKHGSATIKVNTSTNRGRPLFFFTYYEGGRRHQRNFASEEEAYAEAEIICRRLAHGHGAAIPLTGRDRDAYTHAISILEGTGVPLSAAVEEYVAARKKLDGVPLADAVDFFLTRSPARLPQKLVAEVMAEFLEAKRQDQLSERYLDDCRVRLRKFSESFTGFIGNIQAPEIEDWLRGLDVAPRSRNNYLRVVATFFTHARRRGYLRKSEKTEAEMIAKAKDQGGTPDIFTPDEFSRLLEHARPSNLAAILLGGFAGLRQAEILRLDWDALNLQAGHIVVSAEKAKTRQRRIVPIHPSLGGWLRTIVNRRGRIADFSSAHTLAESLTTTAAKAGVQWKQNGLRHSYASYRLADTANAAQVSLEMGNTPQIIFQHYRELVTRAEATKWFSLRPKGCRLPRNVTRLKAA